MSTLEIYYTKKQFTKLKKPLNNYFKYYGDNYGAEVSQQSLKSILEELGFTKIEKINECYCRYNCVRENVVYFYFYLTSLKESMKKLTFYCSTFEYLGD